MITGGDYYNLPKDRGYSTMGLQMEYEPKEDWQTYEQWGKEELA